MNGMLEEVKQRLSITGHDLDGTISGMIDDVVAFCLSAGVKYSQLIKPDVIGLVARGVADLWNYGAGDGKFSQVFHMRLNQLCVAAYAIDGDLLLQAKEATVTENGTTEITPDDGKVLSGVSVSVDVAGGPGIVTIPPVSFPLPSDNIVSLVTDIDLSSIEWTQIGISDISYLFRRMINLRSIKWGDLLGRLADSIKASNMFYDCKNIESVDFSPFYTKQFIDVSNMFNGCLNLKNIVWSNIKFRATRMNSTFFNCQTITSIDTSFLDSEYNGTTNIDAMFGQCYALKSLDLSNLKTAAITRANNIVLGCHSLVNLVFEDGCFPNTSLKELAFTGSPLTHDCAVDIFNKLATRTNSPTLKLSATTMGYLTENEIAIATGKGWVVS